MDLSANPFECLELVARSKLLARIRTDTGAGITTEIAEVIDASSQRVDRRHRATLLWRQEADAVREVASLVARDRQATVVGGGDIENRSTHDDTVARSRCRTIPRRRGRQRDPNTS